MNFSEIYPSLIEDYKKHKQAVRRSIIWKEKNGFDASQDVLIDYNITNLIREVGHMVKKEKEL